MQAHPSHQESSHHEIEGEYDNGRRDNGARGGIGHAFAGRWRGIALEGGDQGDDSAKRRAFPNAVEQIAPHLHGRGHVAPERAVVESKPADAHQVRAEQAQRIEDADQQGHGKDAGEETWRHHVRHRIDGHHLHGRKLVGCAHQADLGGHRGAGATCKQQGGHHRAKLAEHRQGHHRAERSGAAEIGQHIVEFEQGGNTKAEYGDKLLERLSKDLSLKHGKGFSLSNINRFRQFYLTIQFLR